MQDFGYEVAYHTDVEELFDYIKSEDYDYDVCLGLTFDEINVSNSYHYRLHYNSSTPDDY